MLTSRHSVHSRLVEAVQEMIREHETPDGWWAPLAPATLAEAIVRLAEAFIYDDEINHLEPDLTAAHATIARPLGAEAVAPADDLPPVLGPDSESRGRL